MAGAMEFPRPSAPPITRAPATAMAMAATALE